jgi:cellobiose-specific phosphotransferase system component IIC
MSEESNRPKRFKTTLVVVAIVFGIFFEKAVSSKFIWGMFGDNSSWNTWEYQITMGVIGAIVTLLASYYLCRKDK